MAGKLVSLPAAQCTFPITQVHLKVIKWEKARQRKRWNGGKLVVTRGKGSTRRIVGRNEISRELSPRDLGWYSLPHSKWGTSLHSPTPPAFLIYYLFLKETFLCVSLCLRSISSSKKEASLIITGVWIYSELAVYRRTYLWSSADPHVIKIVLKAFFEGRYRERGEKKKDYPLAVHRFLTLFAPVERWDRNKTRIWFYLHVASSRVYRLSLYLKTLRNGDILFVIGLSIAPSCL